jgi:carbon starvation protein
MINFHPKDAPLIFPFLFITVACGAISGFHCLVSSGTSSKQLRNETDARFVGYGGMLTEGFLATLVILACAAGLGLGISSQGAVLTGHEAWASKYTSWASVGGGAIAAFVDGSANFLKAIGISEATAVALMGVLVASFAATTMDTACRLQRYVVQELASTFLEKKETPVQTSFLNPFLWLRNKHGATITAIVLAAILASVPAPGKAWAWTEAGKGGLILWPLFGATNQLLGGLSFMVITFYLWRRNRPVYFLIIPMIFMLIMPLWAMIAQLFYGSGGMPSWIGIEKPNWILIFIALGTIALEVWMIVEAALMFPRAKGVLETGVLEPIPATVSSTAKAQG